MIFGKKVKPAEEKKDKKESALAEIKLAEPVRKVIEEKEAEIRELKEKLKREESKANEIKTEFDALAMEKEELAAKLKEKVAEARDLRSELEKAKDKLAEVEGKLKTAMEGGRRAEVPLEELVYVYILGAGGEIAVSQCARDLGVKKKQVKDAIDKLVKSGRLER